MKRSMLLIAVISICAIFVFITLGYALQDTTETTEPAADPAREKFVPSPIFSPPYPSLPHHFSDIRTIQVLCKAPEGAIEKALAPPLEPAGDTYILLMAWTPDVEKQGYNVHEIAINAPVKYKDKVGQTTLIEYIDSDMGLIAGREVYGWPKKMGIIEWTETDTGWTVTANKMQDQGGIPLMKIEYTVSDSTPEVEWPNMGSVLLVRRIPPASLYTPSFNELVCVGCDRPEMEGPPPGDNPLVARPGAKDTKGTATVQFFDGPHDPLTFLGPAEVFGAKMSIMEGDMPGGLGLTGVKVLDKWEE